MLISFGFLLIVLYNIKVFQHIAIFTRPNHIVFDLVASAKSKGALFVSAMDPIKKIRNIGNSGTIYQIAFCISVLTVKLKLPDNNITSRIAELKINS